jgi:predicted enzyme related to lactoylglutathione lyase
MPTRGDIPAGAPCWIELFTSDTGAARDFYGSLFGWTSEEAGPEYGGYINFFKNGEQVAGCMRNDGSSGMPNTWSVYLATDDAQKVSDAATAHGGQVIVPAMQVMALGSMVVVADPGGAAIGGWQQGEHTGFGVVNEPGAPTWFELHTRSYSEAIRFYEEVFKWDAHTMSDAPEFRYTTLGEGEGARAGIMDATAFLPDDVPSHWSIYFAVEDTDAALDRINELGGSTVAPAEDTPYGRLAHAADPTGALFELLRPPS